MELYRLILAISICSTVNAGIWDCIDSFLQVTDMSQDGLMKRYQWIDGPPPPDFGDHVLPSFHDVPSGASIQVITSSQRMAFTELRGGESIDKETGQALSLNGDYEDYLLDETYKTTGKPEVLHSRGFDSNGEQILWAPRLAVGSARNVSLEKAIQIVTRIGRPRNLTNFKQLGVKKSVFSGLFGPS